MEMPRLKNGKMLDLSLFRNRLNELIDSKGILGKELARDTGITPSSISRYITGRRDPEVEYLYRLSKYFGVTIDYLLGVNDLNNSGMTPEEISVISLYRRASDEDRKVIRALLSRYREIKK